MADLAKNPVWNKVKNEENSVGITGPNYSYSDHVPGPSSLGVGSDGSFGQLFTNLRGIGHYVKVMISGDPPLGDAYFINTGGVCVAPDGSSQPRSNYINNIPGGKSVIPASMKDLGGMTSNMNGLLPGITGDLQGLNPKYLFNAMIEEGNPSCECYKCGVTTGKEFAFLVPSLSPDFDKRSCTAVDVAKCIKSTEKFTNPVSMAMIPTAVAVIGILLLAFSSK